MSDSDDDFDISSIQHGQCGNIQNTIDNNNTTNISCNVSNNFLTSMDKKDTCKRHREEATSSKVDLPKKKKTRIKKSNIDHRLLPQIEFPDSYIRGAKNSRFLVQNRCCYSGYFNTYLLVVEKLPIQFYDLVGKIGFGHFLRNSNISVNSYHLDDLVGRYIGNFVFQLKDKCIQFKINDVSQILGIPSMGKPIIVNNDEDCSHETMFWHKYFGVTQVTSTLVKDVFIRVVSLGHVNEDHVLDCFKLWLCLLFSSFLLPTSKMTIPLRLFYYIENVEEIGKLNWSQLVMDQLFKNMDSASHSVRRRERIGDRTGEYIHGCATVLNVFLWERTNLFPPSSPANYVIFQKYEGSTKRRNRTIACLSNEEVFHCPRSYSTNSCSTKPILKSMVQPTLEEFINNRIIKKHCPHPKKNANKNSIPSVLVPGRFNYSRSNIDRSDDISSMEITLDSTSVVDLCTPSTQQFVGALPHLKKSSIPRSFNYQIDNLSENNLDISSSTIRSPVLLDGLDTYDYMLTDSIQKLQISSSTKEESFVDSAVHPSLEILDSNINVDKANFITSVTCPNNTFRQVEISTSPKILHSNQTLGSLDIQPPSFDLLFEAVDKVLDLGIDISQSSSTPSLNTPSTFLNIKNDGGRNVNEIQFSQKMYSPSHSNYSSDQYKTPMEDKIKANRSECCVPTVIISSPEFWAAVAESADVIERKACKPFDKDELTSVVRCIDFSPNTTSTSDSPYVSSMIKRIKDRNAEKLENEKLMEVVEATNMKDDGKPKKNQTTKKLVMDSKYRSLFFFLIMDDSVFCSGGDVVDIIHHQIYTNLLVKVFFGVIRVELVEKFVINDRFQFIDPDFFSDDDGHDTTQSVPELVSNVDVDNVLHLISRNSRGNDKRNWKYFIIPIRTVNHWHFLVWSRVHNTYTHYDSNHMERELLNLGAAKRAMKWMTMWFRLNFVTVFHDEPTLVQYKKYPQQTNSKMDGGLYMFHGISSFVDYMHIEDGIFNNFSLDSKMTWNKSEVPRIRNSMFRRIAERLEFTPWHTKLANYKDKS
ncbi:hypothetical protein ZOSMA_12G00690 [Zostera marina]|uniref:Ubiquitin-like protease family profile domain-containing protein n=1 Tax=Zostera marina TaxID=29655 RepID=A0A0K9PZ91_ZOSMR|nr:hypothetical protein ZOSMA_12G00690 [Zostera marina]